jgi:hypothetical protein
VEEFKTNYYNENPLHEIETLGAIDIDLDWVDEVQEEQ